ncbi:hypothetical protein [Modestobacter versicolor]|uniref:Uncharacterized protein n=1 Tax=Modestobacter versicolor TaxID=429133 RepID=A0A323V5A6_9ACTN|nr:hypothetical protein [Modestobacter versicolor]MBB3675272.1 hypothetical protein [Modestobacter versicolor]PZA19671.1 hypothetical protein DMO24_19495 [Modestobacter versicolor]
MTSTAGGRRNERPALTWWLEAGWTVAGAVVLVAALVTGSWYWALLGRLVAVGGLIGLRRSRPGAVRERDQREAVAVTEWSPERLRALAAEHRVDPAGDPVALIAALRRADPRLSLTTAKRLVDGLRGSGS